MGIPLNTMMGVVKNDLRTAVKEAQTKSNLPPYLIGAILSEIRAEIAQEEITDLINTFTTKKEEEQADD